MEHFRHEKQFLVRDIRNKFSWAIWARYIIIFLGIVLIYFGRFSNITAPFSFNLVVFVTIYNVIAHAIYWLKKKIGLWQIITLAWIFQFFDILAVTALIYITGWLESPFWFLYLVMIIVSGFGLFSYYSFSVFLIAFFSALFYLGLLLSAYLKILPIYGPAFQLSPEELLLSIYNKAVFTSVAFFLFASTIYYFAKLLNQQREELSKKSEHLLIALNKIKDVDHLKDEFVSTASHELRTPLSVIRENISLIEDGIVGQVDAKQKQLLETSRLNVDHLAKILDNLLDISKIESHSLELHREVTDISQLAAKAIGLLKNKAENKNISMEQKLTARIIACVDAEQILRVFINLLDNAIKQMGTNGKIEVGVEDSKDTVTAYVSDNGPGIAKKDAVKVFERFVHLRKGEETWVKGAGLGLSICRGIIEMHGGRIWFESPPAGADKGAKFIFTLPKGKTND
ncbi:sensor histidine kinase [Candidatus Margulisiibacteriota bacterium]